MDFSGETNTRGEIHKAILGVLKGNSGVNLVKSGITSKVELDKENEDLGVWVSLEISEEGDALKLREIIGRDYDPEDILNIKKDNKLHKEFELMCWEYLVEQKVDTEESLYQMLELIMGTKSGQVLRAKVDSEYNVLDQEVYITYKVKVNA